MSNLLEDANRAVRMLVAAALGLGENDVRPADQTARAGQQSAPFVTVKIISDEMRGTPSRIFEQEAPGDDDSPITESVMASEMIVASVQCWGAAPASARLRGAAASAVVGDYTGVTTGAFDIPIDGATRHVSGVDLSAATTMDEVAGAVEARAAAALAGVTVVWSGKRFLVTSPTTGATSAVGPATASSLATLLGLTSAAGAVGADNKTGIARLSLDAVERTRRLPLLLDLSVNIERMQRLGLGFIRASIVRDLSALAPDAAFESRGSVDLTFNIVSREQMAITSFLPPFDVGLKYQPPSGAPDDIQTIEIEVTP